MIEFDVRDFSLGPLRTGRAPGEAPTVCKLQLANSSYVPLTRQPLVILRGMTLPAALVDTSTTGSDLTAGGSSWGSTGTSTDAVAASLQLIPRTGNFVEAELVSVWNTSGGNTAGGVASLALFEGDRDFRGVSLIYNDPLALVAITLQAVSSTSATLTVWERGVNVSTHSGLPLSGMRYRITVNGSEFKVYGEYTPGKGSLYTSGLAPTFPLRALVGARQGFDFVNGGFAGSASVNKTTMSCGPDLKTVYTSQQREADYGSTGATAYGLLYEVHERYGKGGELQVSF